MAYLISTIVYPPIWPFHWVNFTAFKHAFMIGILRNTPYMILLYSYMRDALALSRLTCNFEL